MHFSLSQSYQTFNNQLIITRSFIEHQIVKQANLQEATLLLKMIALRNIYHSNQNEMSLFKNLPKVLDSIINFFKTVLNKLIYIQTKKKMPLRSDFNVIKLKHLESLRMINLRPRRIKFIKLLIKNLVMIRITLRMLSWKKISGKKVQLKSYN